MPNDAYTLAFLVREWQESLIDAKVNKVVQPESDEIVLTLFGGKTRRLLLSANAGLPRAHLTEHAKENPLVAPQFCMTLRKHLQSAVLKEIEQPDSERIVRLKFVSKTNSTTGSSAPWCWRSWASTAICSCWTSGSGSWPS